MDLLSEFSQLARFLKKQVHIWRPQFQTPCCHMMAGFHVSRTEIVNFIYLPTLIFCLFLEEHLDLSKLGFVGEEGYSGCNSRNRALKGNVLCQIWFKWTY